MTPQKQYELDVERDMWLNEAERTVRESKHTTMTSPTYDPAHNLTQTQLNDIYTD